MTSHLTTDLLIDFLHGQLPPEDDAAVHAHLATCPACRAEYDAEASVGEALRAAAAREEAEFPSLIAAHVWQEIRNARPSPFTRATSFLRPAFALPVAAALVVGTWLASPALQHAASRPSIDAGYYFADHAAQEAQNPFSDHGVSAQTIETSALESDSSTPTGLAEMTPTGDVVFASSVVEGGR